MSAAGIVPIPMGVLGLETPMDLDVSAQRAILLEHLMRGPVFGCLAKSLGVNQPRLRIKELRKRGYRISEEETAGGNGRRLGVVYTLLPASAALQRDFFRNSEGIPPGALIAAETFMAGGMAAKSPAGYEGSRTGPLFETSDAEDSTTHHIFCQAPRRFSGRVPFRKRGKGAV